MSKFPLQFQKFPIYLGWEPILLRVQHLFLSFFVLRKNISRD
ncbi:hypothetical protein LEP1GSC116_1046, partial [Leptospira interrogans serovar Icterohaemorrhagiae str. Verdun HP]